MKKEVYMFVDSDKDDLYSLNVMVAQDYLNNVKLQGIICEDGFLSFPQNICIIQFWLTQLNARPIPIYKGLERSAYLKQQRNFPPLFVTSYLSLMKETFGYFPSTPSYQNIENVAIEWKQKKDHSIDILTTGNLTSLKWLLNTCPTLSKKINRIISMIGNVNVPGNVVPADLERPEIRANSEYNAFLDPDALSFITDHADLDFQIVPLDCTNYAPLNQETIDILEQLGQYYLNQCDDVFLIRNYTYFLQLLKTTILTINTKLYLWDLVATMIYLTNNGQKYVSKDKLVVAWTGRFEKKISFGCKNVYYNYIDYDLLLHNIIRSLFIKLQHSRTCFYRNHHKKQIFIHG